MTLHTKLAGRCPAALGSTDKVVNMTTRRSRRQRSRQSSSSSDSSQFVARTVCFDRRYTAEFTGAPQVVAGPAAVLLGDVDNDPSGDVEIVVGGMDGTLAVFKGVNSTGQPFLTSSGTTIVTTCCYSRCCLCCTILYCTILRR